MNCQLLGHGVRNACHQPGPCHLCLLLGNVAIAATRATVSISFTKELLKAVRGPSCSVSKVHEYSS